MRGREAPEPSGKDSGERLLEEAFTQEGLRLSRLEREAFSLYLRELTRWRRAINLTGFKTRDAMVRELLLGSLPFLEPELEGLPWGLKSGEEARGLRVLDLGSGAGVPGVLIKVLRPELELFFLEASQKKANFLRHISRLLFKEGAEVLHGKAEELAGEEELRETFSIVTARALGPLPRAASLSRPFLKPSGYLILRKGRRSRDEIERAEDILSEEGLTLTDLKPLPPPSGGFLVVAKSEP